MRKYYYIFIEPKVNTTYEQIKKEMDKALDWFQINKSCWIVYSSSEINKWLQRLNKLVIAGGSLFVCELNINNRNGWMTQDFWDWLEKKR